jgi:hypothetical protein
MSKPSPNKVTYWPGTRIVKSTANGFTRTGPSLMASPLELTKATAQVKAEEARKAKLKTCDAFGNHQLRIARPPKAKKAAA